MPVSSPAAESTPTPARRPNEMARRTDRNDGRQDQGHPLRRLREAGRRAGTAPTTAVEPKNGHEPDWKAIQAFYAKCRSPKQTAAEFGLSVNTVKARIHRGGW